MERECVSLRTHIKSFTVNLSMVNWKAKDSFTLLQAIIMLVNSNLTRKKAGVFIDGQARSQIFMRENSRQVKEMEEELSGGLMAAGMKEISKMVFNVVLELCIVKADTRSTREFGKTECSMEKEFNTLKMDSVIKGTLSRINSTVMVYFTKMTQSFTVYGGTTSFQW